MTGLGFSVATPMQTPTEFLTSLALRHRGFLLSSSAVALLGSLISLAYPWLAGSIAQRLLGQGSPAIALPWAFAGLLGLVVAQAGVGLLSLWIWARWHAAASFELRTRVYDHLQALALEQHQARTRGESMTL